MARHDRGPYGFHRMVAAGFWPARDEILELAVGAERKTTKSLGRMGVRNEGGGWRLFLLQRRLDECACFCPHLCFLSQEQVATAFDSDEPRTGDSTRCVAVDRCTRAVWIVD